MSEVRYWQYQWSQKRKDALHMAQRRKIEENDLAVIGIHNEQVGDEGKNIDNLDKNYNNVGNK